MGNIDDFPVERFAEVLRKFYVDGHRVSGQYYSRRDSMQVLTGN